MNEHTQEQKDDGKIQPIKLTPEQLEKRKEAGYKTDEESRRTPSSTMGKAAQDEEPQKPDIQENK
jgi:hypothetical protein